MAHQAGDILVRAIMENANGLPEDRVMNDFAFATGGTFPTQGEIDAAIDAVDEFYRDTGSGGVAPVGSWISETINRSATHTIEVYQITDAGLGSPIFVDDWLGPVAPTESTNLPNEVAAVLSFHADLTGVQEEGAGGTRPRARRRGRVYIGPLVIQAVDYNNANPALVAAFTLDMRAAANELRLASTANGVPWSVWSRVDKVLRPVTGGWTDNAPDTQRRRGQAATSRTVWGS